MNADKNSAQLRREWFSWRHLWSSVSICTFAVWLGFGQFAQSQVAGGIPEPGLFLYGAANRIEGGTTNRLTSGLLVWQFQETANGTSLAMVTSLTNPSDRFSYAFDLPFETIVPDAPDNPAAFNLSPTPANFSRGNVTIDGKTARLIFSSKGRLESFTFGAPDRGTSERVDLEVSTQIETFADWSTRFFGHPNADPEADADGDGMSNAAEYVAGTDPTNASSVFRFLSIKKNPDGTGLVLEWLSQPNKSYRIERAQALNAGFSLLQSGIDSTPLTNTFTDISATGSATFFYRLRIE